MVNIKWEEFLEKEGFNLKKKKLDIIIKNERKRINSHLSGKFDRKLVEEIKLKRKSILDENTHIEKFMNGILKVDIIAQFAYEPKVRNINKNIILKNYLNLFNKDKVKISKDLKTFSYNGIEITPLIFTPSSGDNEIKGKFNRALDKISFSKEHYIIYNNYTQCCLFVKKIKNKYPKITFMNIDEFIEQCLK